MALASFAKDSVRPSAVMAKGSFIVARRAFAASSAMRSATAIPSSDVASVSWLLPSSTCSTDSDFSVVAAPADLVARRRRCLGAGVVSVSSWISRAGSKPEWVSTSEVTIGVSTGPPAARVARRRRCLGAGSCFSPDPVVSEGSGAAAAVVTDTATGTFTSAGGPAGREAARRRRLLEAAGSGCGSTTVSGCVSGPAGESAPEESAPEVSSTGCVV